MTDGTCKDEEVEHGVHILLLVQTIETCARDVADPLSDNPHEGGRGDAVNQGFEGYQHAQSHADETECLNVGVLLQSDKADNGTCNGTGPHKREQRPTPIALGAQGNECQWGVAACYVPVDGGMVPFAEPFTPFGTQGDGVINR